MTREEIIARWRTRLTAFQEMHAQVDGEATARQVLADLEGMADVHEDAPLSLTQASQEGGVSTRQLARLIEDGKLENVGRKGAPRVRRRDIPRKAVAERTIASSDTMGVSLRMARQVVTSKIGHRGRRNGAEG